MLITFTDNNERWNNGYNTVLTGQAGSGKSWTVEYEIIDKYGEFCNIALTGMTGLASCNIKGQTIHSWLNLGIIRENKKYPDNGLKGNIDRIIYSPHAKWEHVKKADVLIIDEISMCDGLTFDVINNVLKIKRENDEPFGGLQVILVGDCYQLPPVSKDKCGYFFQSDAYKEGNFKPYVLRQQHRQSEGEFLNILNRIRVGTHTKEDIDFLNQRDVDKNNLEVPEDSIKLFPKNKDVDNANERAFNALDESPQYFYAKDVLLKRPKQRKLNGLEKEPDYTKGLRVPHTLELKRGCDIMLLANLDVTKGIVNGSKGFFVSQYCDKLLCWINGEKVEVPKQKFEVYRQDELVFTREQYPLVLGYATSIHKSQGMTLNKVFIDFTETFAEHQVYVALSRVKSLDGLYIRGLTMDKIKVAKEVINYMKEIEK